MTNEPPNGDPANAPLWDEILATAYDLARASHCDAQSLVLFARLAYRTGWAEALKARDIPGRNGSGPAAATIVRSAPLDGEASGVFERA